MSRLPSTLHGHIISQQVLWYSKEILHSRWGFAQLSSSGASLVDDVKKSFLFGRITLWVLKELRKVISLWSPSIYPAYVSHTLRCWRYCHGYPKSGHCSCSLFLVIHAHGWEVNSDRLQSVEVNCSVYILLQKPTKSFLIPLSLLLQKDVLSLKAVTPSLVFKIWNNCLGTSQRRLLVQENGA